MQNAEPPKLEKVFDNDDLLNNLRFITRPAQEFPAKDVPGTVRPDSDVSPGLLIPRLEAKRKLQELLERKLDKDESAHLNNTWAEMVSQAELDKALKELQPEIDTGEGATAIA